MTQTPEWYDKILGRTPKTEVTQAELDAAAAEIKEEPGLAKNGWTPQTLAAYFKERGGNDYTPRKVVKRPTRTNGWHNPHKWRRQ